MKSNAARAAKPHGIKRDDLIAVSGGWCFEIPSETAPQSSTEPATAAIDGAHVETLAAAETLASEPAAPADEPIEWGGYDYMVVNGEQPVAAVDPGETYIATVEPNGVVSSVAPAKPKRQRKSPSADKPESHQAPTEPEAEKAAETAPKPKSGNKAPKEGKCADLIAAIKTDWQSFPKLREMTGWLPHTLRGYISRVSKAEGWTLERSAVDGVTHYRIKV